MRSSGKLCLMLVVCALPDQLFLNLTAQSVDHGRSLLNTPGSGSRSATGSDRAFSSQQFSASKYRPIKADVLAAHANVYGKLPLSFESNLGQTDERVKFVARASGYMLFMTTEEAVFAGRDGSVERMKLIGASPKLRFEPLDKQPGISNYFIGNDPLKWRTNIPNYGRVALRGVYPGIDLVFYGNERELEYDWVVAPGADPKLIDVKWEGRNRVTKSASGDLVLSASLVQHKPVILQEGKRIEGGYLVRGLDVAFELAKYDPAKPLVIDPVLTYSTYLGGSGNDQGQGIAVDGSGNAYVTGSTDSTNFPTINPLQANLGGYNFNAFVTKINPAGSALVYSTYLGGSGGDSGNGIAVDSSGNAYLTGQTFSRDFPTANPLQKSHGGGLFDAFVTKISAAGSALVYSTYLGGDRNDIGVGIAVDSSGNAYVTGETDSSNFPTTNPLQASNHGSDVFVTKINAAGSAYVYSTCLGGSGLDWGLGIAVDGLGSSYVTGSTSSFDFPTTNPLQASNRAGTFSTNAFVTKINAAGSALVYSTYLGGSGGDQGSGIAVDWSGNAYVTGLTSSTDFPTQIPIQGSFGGVLDAFVTKINAAGSALMYSTYLGGSGNDQGRGIAVDGLGNAYVTGQTNSTNFPIANPLQGGNGGGVDAFVTKISAAGSALVYSTYLGGSADDFGIGIAVDSLGNADVTGNTSSTNFSTTNPLQPSGGAFILSISAPPQPFTAGGEALTASGGSASLSLTFPSDYAWTASTTADWITFTGTTSGVGNGTLAYQVAPNNGPDRSATITVAGFSFTIEQEASSIPGLSFIGSMPHLAAEENWITTFTLVNKGAASATARLSLFGDDNSYSSDPNGSGLLSLPLAFPQQAGSTGPLLAASFDQTLSANASLIISTTGPQTPPVQIGSAQLAATGAVDGFAIFHQIQTSQEAVVPMETRNASSYLLAFDNTNGLVLGVAVENVLAQNAVIGVVIRDETGTVIGSSPGLIPTPISLAGNGHTSFVLSTQYPVTANIRGTIEFDTPVGGQISVLGLRFTPPNNALTTIPALANVGTTGGSIAHLASGGDGWQTTFVLVNTGTSATQATLSFFADQTGAPLPLPLSFPQGNGTATTSSSVTQTLAAGATLLVQSNGAPQLLTGSAQLSTAGNISGFVIFRHNNQEAVVPLETRGANAYILAFDNTNGTATGVAVNSVSAQSVSVPVIVRDDTGAQLATDTLNLTANGHLAFTLAGDKYSATANIRGTIEFYRPANAQIGVLGIRIPSTQTYTTLPALAK